MILSDVTGKILLSISIFTIISIKLHQKIYRIYNAILFKANRIYFTSLIFETSIFISLDQYLRPIGFSLFYDFIAYILASLLYFTFSSNQLLFSCSLFNFSCSLLY